VRVNLVALHGYGGMVPTIRMGPVAGLVVQVVLLTVLATMSGLGVAGWLAGVWCGLITSALLTRGMSRAGIDVFGPADWVTLTRATLAGCVAAMTADSFLRPSPVDVLVAITIVALLLDAVDGQVARRTGTASGFGTRFDMEVDAFLILVLSVYVARSMGAWVLAIGAMRYAFVAASWVLPWMRASLPPRYWGKVAAAIQGIALVFAAADVLPAPLMVAGLTAALALLVGSFGRDVVWLWHSDAAGLARAGTSGATGFAGSAWRPRRRSGSERRT